MNEQPVQVFIPYATVIRSSKCRPDDLSPDLRRFGFRTDEHACDHRRRLLPNDANRE